MAHDPWNACANVLCEKKITKLNFYLVKDTVDAVIQLFVCVRVCVCNTSDGMIHEII